MTREGFLIEYPTPEELTNEEWWAFYCQWRVLWLISYDRKYPTTDQIIIENKYKSPYTKF